MLRDVTNRLVRIAAIVLLVAVVLYVGVFLIDFTLLSDA